MKVYSQSGVFMVLCVSCIKLVTTMKFFSGVFALRVYVMLCVYNMFDVCVLLSSMVYIIYCVCLQDWYFATYLFTDAGYEWIGSIYMILYFCYRELLCLHARKCILARCFSVFIK